MKASALLCVFLLPFTLVMGQDTTSLVGRFGSKYAAKIEQKTNKIEAQLNKQSQKALQQLQTQQNKAYKALHKIDSNAATAYLNNATQQYAAAIAKLKAKPADIQKSIGAYVPGLDSMNGVLKYFDKLPDIDASPVKEKIKSALSATNHASQALNQAGDIKKLIQAQQGQLKALASRYKDLHISKQIKSINKELFYYGQRLEQAKQTFNNPEKIEQEVLKLLRKNEVFKGWMQQNGQLAGLFGTPAGNTTAAQSLAGLQTRQSVQQLLQNRIGGNIQQAQQLISSQVQQAQGQLSSLRNNLQQQLSKLPGMVNNSSSDLTMPDFKPNSQKTKSFIKRLERGWNLQATQRKGMFPSVNELGVSIGYKLNDKSVVGIGGAYRFGLGESIRKVRWTNEGISLRSYVDIKWKGNWWISGGYEQNYWSRFNTNQFSSIAWQQSGLIGLTKKIALKKKKEMKMQVLYDFLDRTNAGGMPLKFRMGKNF